MEYGMGAPKPQLTYGSESAASLPPLDKVSTVDP